MIFLSHSDKDKKIASELKSKLSEYGMSVFLAHEDIEGGTDWMAKLYEEILNYLSYYLQKIIILQNTLIKNLELHSIVKKQFYNYV
jgi:hypothetical protein